MSVALTRLDITPFLTPCRIARYWEKVDVRGADECWLWTGPRSARMGYARLSIGSGTYATASHAALALDNRPRPSGEVFALHTCDNPQCLNPAHLYWGTQKQNIGDRERRGRMSKEAYQRGAAGLQAWWAKQPPGARSEACRRGTLKVNFNRWGFTPSNERN